MSLFATSRKTLGLLLVVAGFVTLVNAAKPLHIDDPFIYRIAEQISRAPADPYGFDIFWLQWPQPVVEELTPPVLPYWWSLALRVAPTSEFVWKLSLFPFVLLLCAALHALGRRFAPGLETALVLLVALSPAFLPGVNLMQDVPAIALGLTALVLFLRATDAGVGVSLAVAAGAVAGLALQTKYTTVAVLGAMALWALLDRSRLPRALLAIGMALFVFFGWEALLWVSYGHSMFFGQVRHGLYWFARAAMVLPLLRLLGATLPAVLLLTLAALGVRERYGRPLAVLVVGAYALLSIAAFQDTLFLLLGVALAVALIVLGWRRVVVGTGSGDPADLFIVGWLFIEIAVFFLAAPFPAVRRIMGIAVVAALLAARGQAFRVARERAALPWRWPVGVGVVLGLLFTFVDYREATAQRDAVGAAAEVIHARDADPRVWFLGHWGFQHYAESAGMEPVVPDVSVLREGDWLVVPSPVHRQDVAVSRADVESVAILAADRLPALTTGQGYYGGSVPLAHLASPRLTTEVFRVRRETVLPSSWPPAQLATWARMAGGRTAAAALPALVRALEEASSVGRRQAAEGLGALGAHGAPAVAALERARNDPEPTVREAAVAALAAIGADPHPSEP